MSIFNKKKLYKLSQCIAFNHNIQRNKDEFKQIDYNIDTNFIFLCFTDYEYKRLPKISNKQEERRHEPKRVTGYKNV